MATMRATSWFVSAAILALVWTALLLGQDALFLRAEAGRPGGGGGGGGPPGQRSPTRSPSHKPSISPTFKPSAHPSLVPSFAPTSKPSVAPSFAPTSKPSVAPSFAPTSKPSTSPSLKVVIAEDPPTDPPTNSPTDPPTDSPTQGGTAAQVVTDSQCRAKPQERKANCVKRSQECAKKGFKMLFVDRGCKKNKKFVGDGGCRCVGYCGYTCKGVCNQDDNCEWSVDLKKCLSKRTGLPTGPMLNCEKVVTTG